MNLLKILLIFITTTQFLFGATLRPGETNIITIRKTIDFVYADSFAAARLSAESINDTLSGKPLYHLIFASILHAEMADAEDYSKRKEFFAHIDSSMKALKDWLKKNPDDPWGRFYLGTGHAYKSVWHAQHKSWLKSLIEGLKAKGEFSKAVKLDPLLYDAYAGMGNYHFWSSARLSKYIPFLSDNREKGLRELRLARDSSFFSSKLAETGLAWALIHQNKLSEAAKVGQALYDESSGGRVSLWILGGVYWRFGNLKKAQNYYSELLESLISFGGQNYYNLIFCRYRKGVCLYETQKIEEAKTEFETILSYDASKKIRKKHKKTYKKTKEYLKKIEIRLKRNTQE